MTKTLVLLSWATTGQLCDADGTRGKFEKEFESKSEAKTFCEEILRQRPFLECRLFKNQSELLETIYAQAGWELPLRVTATGKYRVMMTEWLSRANLNLDGTFRSADQPLQLVDQNSFRKAIRFSKLVARQHPDRVMAPWIYAPNGKIMQCGMDAVTLCPSTEKLLYLPWWKSIWRRFWR